MAPFRLHRSNSGLLLLIGSIVATLLVYWVGLHGSFLLDDNANLAALNDWLSGKLELEMLLFHRASGMLGRPLSMATFAFNAWLGGYTPFSLKLGNLLIHVLIGLVVFGVLRQLLERDPRLSHQAPLVAGLVAALWLLHPLNVSTVLYPVQRMAQLSSLFILLGLWLYLAIRVRLVKTHSVGAGILLLVAVPTIGAVGFLAKENAIVLPLLCGVLELVYFGGQRRPASVRLFMGAYLLAPAIAVVGMLLLKPHWLLSGYAMREFTLIERLLSQSRALCDYLFKIVLPNPPSMGIFVDDFAISTGLLSPPTTLLSLLFLAGLTALAWLLRKHLPAFAFGWSFFLAAHSVESGIFPLELYFEHRNYLPSIGILLAVVALVTKAGDVLAQRGLRMRGMGALLAGGVLLVFALGTHGRARIWQSTALIAESSLLAHPTSLRARGVVFNEALKRGDIARATQILDDMQASSDQRQRFLGHTYQVLMGCILDHDADPVQLDAALENASTRVSPFEMMAFDAMLTKTAEHGCGRITDRMFAILLARMADKASTQSPYSEELTVLNFLAASFLARAGEWSEAMPFARKAWHAQAGPRYAVPLIMTQIALRDLDGAQRTQQQAKARVNSGNPLDVEGMVWLQGQIEAARTSLPPHTADPALP